MTARRQPPQPNNGEGPNRSRPADSNSPPHHLPPDPPPFSWSSSLLTALTLIGCFVLLCLCASHASTRFALAAARPMHALYPPLVAAMLVGGVCALVCYAPTMLAVLAFQALFATDIRKSHTPPPSVAAAQRDRPFPVPSWEMVRDVLHDGAGTIKLALVLTPVYVLAAGRGLGGGEGEGERAAEARAVEAAAGGQLAAAIMTMKIMLVGVREIWDLVPLVVFKLDRNREQGRARG